jgi:hypothetical protein
MSQDLGIGEEEGHRAILFPTVAIEALGLEPLPRFAGLAEENQRLRFVGRDLHRESAWNRALHDEVRRGRGASGLEGFVELEPCAAAGGYGATPRLAMVTTSPAVASLSACRQASRPGPRRPIFRARSAKRIRCATSSSADVGSERRERSSVASSAARYSASSRSSAVGRGAACGRNWAAET